MPERSQKLMQCLASEDAFAMVEVERGLSLQKCLDAPLLINQKSHASDLIKSIFLIIKRFNNLVNVGKKMNEDQMITLASDLYERFSCETLEDVMLFFKMARNGDFGDFYRLDSVVVLGWIPKYMDQKAEVFEKEIINQKNQRQRQEEEVGKEMSEENRTKLEELTKKLKVKTTINNGEANKANPLFNYQAYLEQLPETVKNLSKKELETMYKNTSKFSHPEVWKILESEIRNRS